VNGLLIGLGIGLALVVGIALYVPRTGKVL